ncbi:hypothetical protein GQ44DRAFT_698055 [Phaeosphaeriaceae sp. PMI808]|nr:hypothetical protein GQ44DRAFT_698055 [Phaeosphaeriaceae sp. PMI808]
MDPLLKACLQCFPASILLRFLVLVICGPGSPATYSLTLHRLLRRFRLSSFVCMLRTSSSLSCIRRSTMDRAHSHKGLDRSRGDKSSTASASFTTPTAFSPTTTTTPSITSPTLPMPHVRSKTSSQVDVVGQGKRLSLQFPIAGPNSATSSPRSRPASWIAPSSAPSLDGTSSPSETNILAVLAAQERFVLELKEELNKAEADLKALKKHYSLHESNKRRNDARKIAPLAPVSTQLIDISSDHEDDGNSKSSASMQQAAERRKAHLATTKSSQRKVFSGSRHLRTLSLLSPDKAYAPSFPQPLDLSAEEPVHKEPELPAPSPIPSDLPKQLIETGNTERYDMSDLPTIQREQLIRAGTKMATDLKNGLFTFIEDIRQATVGDEAVNGEGSAPNLRDPLIKGARKASNGRPSLNRSASSKKSSQRTGSIGDDFWQENGLSEPKTSSLLNRKTHTNKSAQTPQKQTRSVVEEEEWDNWETPNTTDTYMAAKTVDAQDSSDESDAPSSPGPASSRTSTRYHSKRHDSKASSLTTTSSNGLPDDIVGDSKRNSIPWADLVKLSPNNLKRTASHLMKEWEKQLTPPPESRGASHGHGDYIGRSSSPSNLV